jgi:hypothetical protein
MKGGPWPRRIGGGKGMSEIQEISSIDEQNRRIQGRR